MRRRQAPRPKFSGVSTRPRPKCHIQIRFTCTRARIAAAREFGRVAQRANARRRPVVRAPDSGGAIVQLFSRLTQDAKCSRIDGWPGSK